MERHVAVAGLREMDMMGMAVIVVGYMMTVGVVAEADSDSALGDLAGMGGMIGEAMNNKEYFDV